MQRHQIDLGSARIPLIPRTLSLFGFLCGGLSLKQLPLCIYIYLSVYIYMYAHTHGWPIHPPLKTCMTSSARLQSWRKDTFVTTLFSPPLPSSADVSHKVGCLQCL